MTRAGESSGLVRLRDRLVRWNDVREVDLSELARSGIVLVRTYDTREVTELRGADAIDFVMRVAPAFVEGRRFRWLRFGWALHNLVGHPLLQLLAWAGHAQTGLRIHDATIPRPRDDRASPWSR